MSRMKGLAGEPEGERTGRLRKEGPVWLPMSWTDLRIDGYGALVGETDFHLETGKIWNERKDFQGLKTLTRNSLLCKSRRMSEKSL